MRGFMFFLLAVLLIVLFTCCIVKNQKTVVERIEKPEVTVILDTHAFKVFRFVDNFHNVIYYTDGARSQFSVVPEKK